MSKKGGSPPKTATYYVGMHLVLCHGPVDKITVIEVDKKIVWQGDIGDGTVYINQEKLFGGIEREGGIKGYLDICLGKTTQAVNSYLASKLGADIPAFRNVLSIVIKNMYVGTNYYLKPWSFLTTRIQTKGYQGGSQWFPSFAEVPSTVTYAYQNNLSAQIVSITNIGSLAIVQFDGTLTYDYIETIDGVTTTTQLTLNPGHFITVSGASDKLYNGTFAVDSSHLTTTTIAYRMTGTPSAAALGPLRIQEGGVTYRPAGLINAVHVLRECLTDTTWGLNYSDTLIDEASWELAAYTCWSEGLGFSWLWESGSVQDFMDDVLKHIQANIYQSHIDGTFHINLLRQLTSTDNLIVLNSTNTSTIANFHISSLGSLVSSVTVKYTDNDTWEDASSIPVLNLSLATRQSTPVEKVITYSGVCSLDVAQKLALRDLQQLSTPVYTCTITTTRVAENLNKGDAFVFDRPDYIGAQLVMRVASINLGTQDAGAITIEAIQDSFQSPTISYITPTGSSWVSPINDPTVSTSNLVFEIPYYLYALFNGDANAQALATTSTYFLATCVAPSQGCFPSIIAANATGSYEQLGLAYTCGSGTLVASMDRISTTVTLENIVDSQYLIVGNFVQINDEFMNILTINDNILTVQRGILDTIPEVHSVGDRLFGVEGHVGSDLVTYVLGESFSVKLLTVTPKGTLDISLATPIPITLYGRMHRPYPPANLTLNGVYWPTSLATTSISLSWATRNRFQQTTDTFISYYTGSITSEVGVTYAYDLSQSNGTIIASSTGITGTSATITTSYKGSVILTIWSINANGISKKVTVPFSLI